jgi:TRAP transporter 4TM/12TM fusion protein
VGFYIVALAFTVFLLRYYATGAGGPTRLAVAMVPVAYIVATLDDLRRGQLYPRLGAAGSATVAAACMGLAVAAGVYLNLEFDAIRFSRLGLWTTTDKLAGATLIILLLEYSRRKYLALFVLNVLLAAYVVYGNHVPGLFNHPGLSWERVITSMSLETTTGIFERLSQLALTLIGSFMLVLAVLRGFGAIDSVLKAASRLATKSPHLLPQSAVIGSFGVAAISGSGAANAATTGSATIPVLIKAGMSRVRAAAIETASSLGGQLMPPLMGISAFLLADFMRVSYFEVVARGFAPALIYFAGVSFAVFLLARRYLQAEDGLARAVPDIERIRLVDKINLAAYASAIAGLIYLMGVLRDPPMQSAQRVFFALLIGLSLVHVVTLLRSAQRGSGDRRNAAAAGRRSMRDRVNRDLLNTAARPYARFVETFARITSELTVLLAILGLVVASFTITGVPTKVGYILLEQADVNIPVLVLVAFVFGYIIGTGLPPAPTYIIVAVVITPFMIAAGLEPWTAHFFAFLVAVFGELSPPTSLTAAITSRIAEAPFVRTMFRALELCTPLFVLMIAVFTWPGIIVEPGMSQVVPALAVLTVTIGVTAALHMRLPDNTKRSERILRAALAAAAIGLLTQPPAALSIACAAVVVIGVAYGLTAQRTSHR